MARVSGGCWTVCEAQRRVSQTHPKGRGFVSKGETWGAKPEGCMTTRKEPFQERVPPPTAR